jgi:hypothetical protein
MTMTIDDTTDRELALKRLKKRHDFHGHLFAYTLINGFLVLIWALTGHGFFWPMFPILGWGIGVFFNAWDVYRTDTYSEEQIQREIAHLHKSR